MSIVEQTIQETEEIRSRPELAVSFLKRTELPAGIDKFGQIYVETVLSGKPRGNHYHKKRHEWIVCIVGKIKVTVHDLKTAERKEFVIDAGESPIKRIYIPPFVAHAVENIGNCDALIVEYASEEFNPVDNDFHKFEVLK